MPNFNQDNEQSADPLDQASNYELKFTEMSLQKQIEDNKPPREYEEGEIYACEDCDCDMPIERAKRGYSLCIDCQMYEDKLKKIKKIRGEL